jgi:hypothetical protein
VGLTINDLSRMPRPPSSWPFMSAPHTHDLQICPEGVGVPARQEVTFKDGHSIWLQRVMQDGSPSLFLRDLGEPAAGARVDLRRMVPEAAADLPITSTRDLVGYVSLALRGQYPTRDAFVEAAVRIGSPE